MYKESSLLLYPPYLCFFSLVSTADNNCVEVWLLSSVHVAWGAHLSLFYLLEFFFYLSFWLHTIPIACFYLP